MCMANGLGKLLEVTWRTEERRENRKTGQNDVQR